MDETKLTNCPVCDGKISVNAPTCPHCGEPSPAISSEREEDTNYEFDDANYEYDATLAKLGCVKVSDTESTVTRKRQQAKNRSWDLRNPTNIIAIAIFGLGVLIFCAAKFHVVTGSNFGMKVISKESMGFKDTFINIDVITSMPAFSAYSQYPIAVRVLRREGLIESRREYEDRVYDEVQNDINRRLQDHFSD